MNECGADVTARTAKGRTAHATTQRNGSATYTRQREILSFLKSKGLFIYLFIFVQSGVGSEACVSIFHVYVLNITISEDGAGAWEK